MLGMFGVITFNIIEALECDNPDTVWTRSFLPLCCRRIDRSLGMALEIESGDGQEFQLDFYTTFSCLYRTVPHVVFSSLP